MPQVVDLPPIGAERGALQALVRVCKETPAKGEPFREFRGRLRGAKLWDRERPLVMLRFLGVTGSTIAPSAFMQALAAATTDDDLATVVLDRLWALNPLLTKTVLDLVGQRAYHKDEIYKYLTSIAFKGRLPSRPALETYLQIAIATGLLRTLGVAVALGPRAERLVALANAFDVDEFLAEDKPDADPVIPSATDDESAAAAPEATAP
ncbi:MAG TPA: hypothetical protein VLT45_18025, partial [Kofleriaceae bacterium]|nr:hypothetical protein [Kofleriaceae bacterium]